MAVVASGPRRRAWVAKLLGLVASSLSVLVSMAFPWAFYRTPSMDSWVPQPHPPVIGLMVESEILVLAGAAAVLLAALPGRQSRILLLIGALVISFVWLEETIPLIDQRLLGGSPLPGSRFSPGFGYWLLSLGLALTLRSAWDRGHAPHIRRFADQ